MEFETILSLLSSVVSVIAIAVTAWYYYNYYYLPAHTATSTQGPTGSTAPVPSSADWVSLSGFDYSLNDLSNMPLTNKSQSDCASACLNTTGCVAGLYSPSTQNCWLKSGLTSVGVPNTDRVLLLPPMASTSKVASWPKFSGQDHGGDDIACYQDGSSSDKCGALCAVHGKCTAYASVGAGIWTGSGSAGGCCAKTVGTPRVAKNGIDTWSSS